MSPANPQISRSTSGPRRAFPAWLAVAMAAAIPFLAGCDAGGPERHAFVETLGDDTVAVESFTRTADSISGDLVVRTPSTRVAHYEAQLDADGDITRLEVEWRTPAEAPEGGEPERTAYIVAGDSVTIERTGGQNPGTTRMVAPEGVIPSTGRVPMSYAILDHALRQAVAAGGEQHTARLVRAGQSESTPTDMTRLGGDTIAVDFFGSPMLAVVGPEGGLSSLSGRETTLKIETRPAEVVDIAALASDFAARDARGEGLGVASPRAQAEGDIGGANVSVDYSQPAMRGRDIWGALVPHGEVWRTGANAATQLSTDADLMIGDTRVPAGTYTLWSVYTPEGGQLIINEQTGQWGTQYDESRDLARIEMERGSVEEARERFTIELDGERGALDLIWDTVRWTVPVRPAG